MIDSICGSDSYDLLKLVIGPCLGVVIGSFFTLGGILLTNYLTEKKRADEKRREILENLSQSVTFYFEYLNLMYNAENMKGFIEGEIIHGNTKHESLNNQYSQSCLAELFEANRNLINMKAEIQRLYTSYTIHFAKDEILKSLINEFLKKEAIIYVSYERASNRAALIEIQHENVEKIRVVMNSIIGKKKAALLAHIGGMVSRITKSKLKPEANPEKDGA